MHEHHTASAVPEASQQLTLPADSGPYADVLLRYRTAREELRAQILRDGFASEPLECRLDEAEDAFLSFRCASSEIARFKILEVLRDPALFDLIRDGIDGKLMRRFLQSLFDPVSMGLPLHRNFDA